MDKKEFRKEALKLGWTDKMIDEQIEMTEEIFGKDNPYDYSVDLMVLPIND